jgi:hypothetical protein
MGNYPLVEGMKNRILKHWGKFFQLKATTEHERNLTLKEIQEGAGEFRFLRIYPYHLLYRVRKLLLPSFLHPSILFLDHYVLKLVPALKFFAGAAVIHIQK